MQGRIFTSLVLGAVVGSLGVCGLEPFQTAHSTAQEPTAGLPYVASCNDPPKGAGIGEGAKQTRVPMKGHLSQQVTSDRDADPLQGVILKVDMAASRLLLATGAANPVYVYFTPSTRVLRAGTDVPVTMLHNGARIEVELRILNGKRVAQEIQIVMTR